MNQPQPVTFGRRGVQNKTPAPIRLPGPQTPPAAARVTYAQLLEAGDDDAVSATPHAGNRPWEGRGRADDRLMERFIGPNWPSYQNLWRAMKDGGAPRPSFSYHAFSLSSLWLFYRRLYGPAFVVLGCELAITRLPVGYSSVCTLLLALFVGVFGKSLVIRRGMRTMDDVEREDLSSSEATLQMERKGGTRLLAPLVVAVSLACVLFVGVFGGARKEGAKTPWQEIESTLESVGAAQ